MRFEHPTPRTLGSEIRSLDDRAMAVFAGLVAGHFCRYVELDSEAARRYVEEAKAVTS